MKIGIIGFGYWGKIVFNNLLEMKEKDIILCDISFKENDNFQNFTTIKNYKEINDCDLVFVTTLTTTHYEICKYFLEKKVNVFCEKPLTLSSSEAEKLYDSAIKNNVNLFTDWIFTFNNQIETIKNDYLKGKLGKIKSILMNRLNLGPERFDVNARWDLASHDISIIQYLFSEQPIKIMWTDYKRNNTS